MRKMTWITSYFRSGSDVAGSFVAGYLLDTPPGEACLEALLDKAPELVSMLSCGRMLPLDERMPYAALTSFPPGAGVLDPYTAVTGKVLYLIRDPRSLVAEMVLTSRAPVEKRIHLARKLISRIDASGEGGTAWQAHVQGWTSPDRVHARFPNLEDVRVVRFEDLRRDPAGALRQVLEFLALPERLDEARIQRAVQDWAPEKVHQAAILERPPGLSAFQEPPPPVEIPDALPSLGEIGPEAEAAYQQQLRENPEFAAVVTRFGYES